MHYISFIFKPLKRCFEIVSFDKGSHKTGCQDTASNKIKAQ